MLADLTDGEMMMVIAVLNNNARHLCIDSSTVAAAVGEIATVRPEAAAEVVFEKSHVERGDAWWGNAPLAEDDRVFERIQVWPSVMPQAAEQGVVMADHAGFYETSLLMAARPDLVDLDRIGPDAPWYTISPTSDAREASVEAGQKMWAAMVGAWVDRLSKL